MTIPLWAGSIEDDGTVTYTNNYGAVDFNSTAAPGDRLVIVFADVPSYVQLYWVDDPYETEEVSWGSIIADANCHY